MQDRKPMDKIDSTLRSVCEKLKEAELDIAEGRAVDAKRSLKKLRDKYQIMKA